MTAPVLSLLAVLSIWDYPARQPQHELLRAEFVQAVRAGDTKKMEESSRKGTELLPDDPTWAYNLACSLAYRKNPDEALDQLEKAIDLGFRDADAIAADSDLRRVSSQRRFKELVEYAKESAGRPIMIGPLAVADATGVVGGSLALGEQNMLWDFDVGCFVAKLALAPGVADGNSGDLYMNRDGGHSRLVVTNFPGITEVKLDKTGRERRLDLDFPNIRFPRPVFGNCSRAYLHDVYWRSIPRAMMTSDTRNLRTMSSFYMDNQIWVFPANADFPPVGTNGDVFASVAPYWLVTQGRSWSDQYYLRAALEASRSLDQAVKREIVERRLLAPTVMTLLRKSLKGVKGEDDYLTDKAHPTCLPPNGLDLARLKKLAADMRATAIPPVVRITRFGAPVEKKPDVPELTYLTPFAAAFVLRAPDAERTFAFAVEGAGEIAYRIVHDPLGAAKIKEQKGPAALVSIDREKLKGTARVDIAAFGRNPGTGWGAPTYISFSVIDKDAPYYDPALVPRIEAK